MFLLHIKFDQMSFETKGRQNLQKIADFVIKSIVFCPLVPPCWISLVGPTSTRYTSAIYVSYIYGHTLGTSDFANAFLFPGVNSQVELVPSPRANARNGASRSWLGDKTICEYTCRDKVPPRFITPGYFELNPYMDLIEKPAGNYSSSRL